MSGAKVVLAMLGATLAVAVLAIAAFFLTQEDKLLCVEGELQDNAVDAQGRFIPREASFATVEEAEAFVCKRVPHPRDTEGLVLQSVEVIRDTNLGTLVEGDGRASVSFLYVPADEPDAEVVTLDVMVSFPPLHPPAEDPAETLTIDGHDAVLVEEEDGTFIYWSTVGYDFAAGGRLGESFTRADMLAALESIR